MKRQIVLSPVTLALGLGLALAVVVIAVMATLMLTAGENRGAAAAPVMRPPSSTVVPTTVPSPVLTPTTAAVEAAAIATATVVAPTLAPPPPTPVIIVVPPTVAAPTATTAPPVPAASTPRYASVDARPYWDKWDSAAEALNQTGVTTYQQALASPTWYARIEATADALLAMQQFVNALPYTDACKTALNILGQKRAFFYGGLMNSVRAPIYPIGAPPTGQAGWNDIIGYWQPRFNESVDAASAACGY